MKIDLPYIVQDTDRHGNVRIYLRRKGHAKVRLREPPGTKEFLAEYQAALSTDKPHQEAASAIGSLEWLGRKYMASVEFQRLDKTSQRTRAGILRACFEERRKPGAPERMGECPAARVDARIIRVIRDRKADFPAAANNRLKSLSAMFAWAVEAGHLQQNPTRDVKRLKYASDGFHTWTDEEVQKFEARHPPGTKARLALALLLYTGARRGDVVQLGRQHVQGQTLRFVPSKTRYKRSEALELPILPELAEELENAPTGSLTFLLTEYGRPFTAAGFGNWFRHRCDEAGLPLCTAHGLRKAGATRAAENGATDRQLMAIFGWTTATQASAYTRKASRRKLAQDAGRLLKRNEK